MKTHSPFTSKKRVAGFTLLELLLTIGLLGLLLAGLYGILNNWTERAVNRQAASDMLRLKTAAHDYVLANFDSLRLAAPNQFVEIPVNDLKPENYLPSGFVPVNAFRQQMRIFRRNLQTFKLDAGGNIVRDAAGNDVIITTIEVVVVSDNAPSGATQRVPNKRLIDTATAGGPAMGVVADLVMPSFTFTGLVTSLYNQWYVQRSALAVAGYGATPDSTEGGYLATYDLVSSESSDANEHWLYRVPVEGRPELNRMATDLNMNANELQNVGTVIADKYTVEGNAAFRGQAQGAAAETAQGMTIEQALRVDSANDVRFNMKTGTGGCSFSAAADGGNRTLTGSGCTMSGGEIQTVGEARINPATGVTLSVAGDANMGVIDAVTADGNVITDFTNVAQTTDVAGISTFDTIGPRGAGTINNMNTSTTALAPTTNVTGPSVTTQQYQTGNMGVTNGATIINQLVTARAAPGLTHRFQTKQLTVGNAVQLTGKLGASAVTANDTLYLDNAQAPGSYRDPTMNNHLVECVAHTNGRTYCEPRGQTFYLGNTVYDNCWDNGSGYTCQYFRNTIYGWQYFGQCNFTRSVGASGQAYEAYSCT